MLALLPIDLSFVFIASLLLGVVASSAQGMDDAELERAVDRLIRVRDFQDHELIALNHVVLEQGERLYPIVRRKLHETNDPMRISRLVGMVVRAPGDRTQMLPTIRGMIDSVAAKEDAGVLARVVWALAEIGNQAEAPLFTRLLLHEQWRVRDSAARALGSVGATESVPALVATLYDPHPNVRLGAARALGMVGDEHVLAALDIWARRAVAADASRGPEDTIWLPPSMHRALEEATAAIRERTRHPSDRESSDGARLGRND